MKNLKNLRIFLNKTQAEVAEALQIKRATYARYENDETEPDFETLGKMADYFSCTVDYLIGRDNGGNSFKQSDLLNLVHSLSDEECDKVMSFIKGMRS